MDKNLKLVETVMIKASPAAVWKALTDPETIERFMWGTHATSDWKVGSSITFEGVYQGKPYQDKGMILESEKENRLKYTFLSGTNEDRPENYAVITYTLSGDKNETSMTVTQEGANDEKALEHSRQGWKSILNNLKEILEN
ncbi:MAG: SRPBCC family protein [Chryseosolibacter sp.]